MVVHMQDIDPVQAADSLRASRKQPQIPGGAVVLLQGEIPSDENFTW